MAGELVSKVRQERSGEGANAVDVVMGSAGSPETRGRNGFVPGQRMHVRESDLPVGAPPGEAGRRLPNLAFAFQEILTVVTRLQGRRQQAADAAAFRLQIHRALAAAQQTAQRGGYSAEETRLAMQAVIAFLDETLCSLEGALGQEWRQRPMQALLFGTEADNLFAQNLARALGRPDAADTADLLEVFYLCLLLGYQGPYANEERQGMVGLLGDRLRHLRPPARVLSPDGALPADEGPAWGSLLRPVWVLAAWGAAQTAAVCLRTVAA